jgi:hypothetical protein
MAIGHHASWSPFKLWLKIIMHTILLYLMFLSFFSSISFPLIPPIIPHVFKCPIYHGRNIIEPTSKSSAPWKASCQWLDHHSNNLPKGPTYMTPNSTPISLICTLFCSHYANIWSWRLNASFHTNFTNHLSCIGS